MTDNKVQTGRPASLQAAAAAAGILLEQHAFRKE